MEEVQQLIVWRQKIEDLLGFHGLSPQIGPDGRGAPPDWRRNAKPHPAQNFDPPPRAR